MRARVIASLVLLGVPAMGAATAVGAQVLVPAAEAQRGTSLGRVHVEARPGSPIMAVSLALPVGSAADPPGAEGTARVAAGVLARQVEAALGPGGGPASFEVGPYRTVVTVLAPSDAWSVVLDALVDQAFGADPDASAVAAELAALEEVLVFEFGAPVLDVRIESARLLLGTGDPGVRPPGGTVQGVRAIDAAAVAAFRRAHFDPREASLAVVGTDGVEAVLRHLGVAATPPAPALAPPVDSTGAPADTVAPASPATPARAALPSRFDGARAWSAGDRVRVVQDVTSTWIMAAYPVPDDMPRTLAEFAADRLHEELNPEPADPGLFSARVQLRDLPRGRALVVEVAVLPDAAERWEARVLGAVEELARPADESFFLWQRRRFRAAVLLAEAAPEVAARRHVVDLLTLGGVRDLGEALWRLDAAALTATVTSLGPPRILVYGPDLSAGPPAP